MQCTYEKFKIHLLLSINLTYIFYYMFIYRRLNFTFFFSIILLLKFSVHILQCADDLAMFPNDI